MRIFLILFSFLLQLFAHEPIKPIPKKVEYNRQKAELGKLLFFDPILSKDRTVSCASCHDPDHGGADPRPVSIGVGGKRGSVNSPTVFNAYFNFRQFWNGRAKDLKEQALGPIHATNEMAMTKELVEKRLNQNPMYKELFKKVYGKERITFDMVVDAIAEFEKALYTPDSKFDRFLRGEIELSPKEKKGYILFKELGCITCHNGINIGGNSFQKMGLVRQYKQHAGADLFSITKRPEDKGVYKVPTLRNIALTAPYFHNASAKSLEEAIDTMSYYNLGFKLTQEEKDALVAFLKTLTGKKPEILEQ